MRRITWLALLTVSPLALAQNAKVPDFLQRIDSVSSRPFCRTYGCRPLKVTVGPHETYPSVVLTTSRYEIQKIFGQLTIIRMTDGYVYDMQLTASAYPLAETHAQAFSALTKDLLNLSLTKDELNTCLNNARKEKDLGMYLTLVDQWAVGCALIPQDGGFKSVLSIWPIG
ncbi:hypothetical protein DEDE109153_08465 [Deinococcus deserti]|uniref:Uncharacterized protein n=1 Tax=Deinococcus deserti (strain DSM 17065 / CIP 109153 / LMG 22923 / VCD115) TaxID=546414 RepID=C1D3U4_DEIDV|nr:hypothetical protein [Deinococcus deserti]ACO48173.1 Hypothetical protein, precursor [Deinococcus deserti VCD115]